MRTKANYQVAISGIVAICAAVSIAACASDAPGSGATASAGADTPQAAHARLKAIIAAHVAPTTPQFPTELLHTQVTTAEVTPPSIHGVPLSPPTIPGQFVSPKVSLDQEAPPGDAGSPADSLAAAIALLRKLSHKGSPTTPPATQQ